MTKCTDPALELRATETEIFSSSVLTQIRKLRVAGLEVGINTNGTRVGKPSLCAAQTYIPPGMPTRLSYRLTDTATHPELAANDFWIDFGGDSMFICVLVTWYLPWLCAPYPNAHDLLIEIERMIS